MTQRLETKIGTQGGLETNVQSDQSAGYQIADNVLYRPIGGVSKRRGSKKLVETVEGETKRLISPTQDGTGVLSIQEDDSTGDAKVLGYKKEGTRVDLYCLDNSYFLTLDPESDFSAHNKVRLEFPEEIYTTDLSFIESAFEEKTGALSGFWTLQTSFTTIAVEQDSVDPDLLRVARFVNLPTKTSEITITATNSFSVAPNLSVNYDIISVSADYFTIYPTGGGAPAWTSAGDTGTINFTFQTLKIIELNSPALTTDSLLNQNVQCFYETQGTVPTLFSCDEIKTVLEDRSGDEIVFNSNLGQMYLSDENPNEPKVSYYGVPQGIDVVTFSYKPDSEQSSGCLKTSYYYAYSAVFKKEINGQVFKGAPSPFFYTYIRDGTPFISVVPTILFGGNVQIPSLPDYGDEVFLQFINCVSTPAIGDYTVFKAQRSGTNYIIKVNEQIRVLGSKITAFTGADAQHALTGFCSITIPESFYEDFIRESGSNSYSVELYRTVGTTTNPDISQLFLVKEKELSLSNLILPHILVLDDEIDDIDLESQLPLYTNSSEEGSLKANNLAPQHQNFTEKNGVFYIGDLRKPKINSLELSYRDNGGFFEDEPIIEPSISEVRLTGSSVSPSTLENYFYSTLSLSLVTGITTYGTFDFTSGFIESDIIFQSIGYFLCTRLDTLEEFVGYVSGSSGGTLLNFYSLNGNINALDETKTLLCLVYPLWRLDGTDLKLISYDGAGFDNASLGLGIEYQRYNAIYPLIYRPLNLSPKENPSFLDGVATNFYNKSNFTLFYNDTSFINGFLSTTVNVERKILESYSSIFPSWSFIETNNENFDLEEFKYQIAYSKPFEPAAFPSLQFLNVGSTKNIVYGIFKVRDSLLIASKEGFYRLTGDNELDYVITLIEADTAPLTPLLMTEQQDRVLSLTQKGLAACSESSLEIIDAPIQDITERFLQLYRDDLDSFTVKQTYTAAPKFLNQVVFYMPTLFKKDTSQSTFGLSFDTSYNRFATVDLYVDDQEKTGVLSQAFDASRFSNESYSSPSFEPSSLQVVRASVNRSDFAQNQAFIELGTFWECDASIIAGSSILTLTTGLDHRLQPGDYVTLISGEAFVTVGTGLSASLFANAVHSALIGGGDPRVFSIDLGSTSGESVSNKVRFRFGRAGLPATISLTSGSLICTLTLASQADVGWLVGQKIYLQKPYDLSLASIENFLNNSKNITSKVPNTIEFSLPAASPITTSAPCIFSEDLRDPYKQTFSFVAPSFVNNQSFAFKYLNDRLLYPFEKENTGARIQGFLERPWDIQYKPDRPSLVFDSVKSTIQTSRITGGDPCSLKNFGQIILSMQSIFSMTKCILAFQGDRYDAAGSITFRSQNQLNQPFDPAFADTLWSAIAQQWSSITNSDQGWKEAGPFTPIRITTPTNVAQSTYLSIYILHDRPFETMAFGSIAVNGTFIDPTSSGV